MCCLIGCNKISAYLFGLLRAEDSCCFDPREARVPGGTPGFAMRKTPTVGQFAGRRKRPVLNAGRRTVCGMQPRRRFCVSLVWRRLKWCWGMLRSMLRRFMRSGIWSWLRGLRGSVAKEIVREVNGHELEKLSETVVHSAGGYDQRRFRAQ